MILFHGHAAQKKHCLLFFRLLPSWKCCSSRVSPTVCSQCPHKRPMSLFLLCPCPSRSPWLAQTLTARGCSSMEAVTYFGCTQPCSSPVIQGDFIVFANEAPRLDWPFAFPRTSHSPRLCSQPLESHRGREGKGWDRILPPSEPRNPQLASRNVVQISLSYSGVQCLIHTGVPLHKLPKWGCFGGQCSIVPVGKTPAFGDCFFCGHFYQFGADMNPSESRFIIQRSLRERSWRHEPCVGPLRIQWVVCPPHQRTSLFHFYSNNSLYISGGINFARKLLLGVT